MTKQIWLIILSTTFIVNHCNINRVEFSDLKFAFQMIQTIINICRTNKNKIFNNNKLGVFKLKCKPKLIKFWNRNEVPTIGWNIKSINQIQNKFRLQHNYVGFNVLRYANTFCLSKKMLLSCSVGSLLFKNAYKELAMCTVTPESIYQLCNV